MIRKILIVSIIGLTVGLASSCVEDLPRVSKIDDVQPIGTRIEIPDDSTLVWPQRGGTARISWEVVYPKLATNYDELKSMFIVCTPAPVNTTIPLCLEFFLLMNERKGVDQDLSDILEIERLTCEELKRFWIDQSDQFPVELFCVEGEPSFEIAIPEEPLDNERLVAGVLCDKGEPFIDTTRSSFFGCELEDGGREMPAVFFVPLQPEDMAPNHHPSLQNATFRIDDREWPEVSVQVLRSYLSSEDSGRENFDCKRAVDDGVLLEVDDDEEQILSVEFEKESLERFEAGDATESEELKIAHYYTAGELVRDGSIVRREWDFLGFDLEWKPPKKIPGNGLFTRIFFTVRDGRGGFDSAMRAFCVRGE